MATMVNRTNAFIKFQGTFTTNCLLLLSKNPFSSFQLGLGFRPHKTPLATFHSNCSSNHDLPRSMFHKITKLDDALDLFDEMTHRRPLPSDFKFTQLLDAVTKMEHYSCSIDLFKQMCTLGVPINEYTTSIVIKSCCQLWRPNEGFAVLGFCFKRAIVPGLYTFITLLNRLILEGRILEAEILFKNLIEKKDCEPNAAMYNTMIKGHCKFNNNAKAIALLRLMDERGCKPNIVSYNTIIANLCKDTMIDDALKLFKIMYFRKGIPPNAKTFKSLVHGFCNSRRWDEFSTMVIEIVDERISPHVQTINILVDTLCKRGRMEDAQAVINIMVERGMVPNVVTYNSLINGYCLEGNIGLARETFDSMAFRGIFPDVVTYNILLNGYYETSWTGEAMHMIDETMLQRLFRAGRCEGACELFDEMQSQGQDSIESTYIITLKGLCDNHQVEEALSLFHLMGDSMLSSDIVVYTTLIDGARNCGRSDIARVLFDDLTDKGLQIHYWAYAVLIDDFCYKGLLGDAKQFLLKMEKSGCPPLKVTYNVLLYAYVRNQQYDVVEMLLQQMDERGYLLFDYIFLLLREELADGLLDITLLKLIGKLVPKESIVLLFAPVTYFVPRSFILELGASWVAA